MTLYASENVINEVFEVLKQHKPTPSIGDITVLIKSANTYSSVQRALKILIARKWIKKGERINNIVQYQIIKKD